jgi:hypothetical protein
MKHLEVKHFQEDVTIKTDEVSGNSGKKVRTHFWHFRYLGNKITKNQK